MTHPAYGHNAGRAERMRSGMDGKAKRIGEVCFWTGLIIELLIVIVDKSAYINPWEGQLFRLTFLLFLTKAALTRYTAKEWLCILVMGLTAAISYFVNGKDEAVRAAVLIVACRDMPLDKVLKIVLGVTLAGSIVLFVLSVTGIYGAVSVTADFGRGASPGTLETRYCFGMGHPNAFQTMLLMMSSLTLYLYADKMKAVHFVALLAVNLLFYMLTDSNTAILVCVAMIAGVMLMKYCGWLRKNRVVYCMGAILILGLVAFSVYGAHVGRDTPVMYQIDKALNGRFQYAHVVENARLENWKLFSAPENDAYFDQGWIRLFYWYGIIPGIVYVAGNLYLVWHAWRKQDGYLFVMILAYSVFSIMEAHLISVYLLRNYLLIFWGGSLFAHEGSGKKEWAFWDIRKFSE